MALAVVTSRKKLSLKEALALGAPSRGTLLRWNADGCPFLDGRKLHIERLKFDGERGAPKLFFLADQIQAILKVFEGPVFKGIRHERDGTDWLTLTRARREMALSPLLLKKYGNKRCPLLNGRVLQTRAVDVVEMDSMGKRYFRRRAVYLKTDLQEIRQGQQIGDEWIRISECGYSHQTIRDWENGCPDLGGRKLKLRTFWTLIELPALTTRRGIPRKSSVTVKPMRYALLEDIEAIDRVRNPPATDRDPNWLTCAEAAAEFQLTEGSVYGWGRFGCPLLGGRQIQTKKMRLSDGRAVRKRMTMYQRSDLEVVAQRLKKRPRTIHRDSHGEWLSRSAAIERFPISPTDLRDWHRRGHPNLSAGWRLRAQQVPVAEGAWRTKQIVWVYLQQDILKAIAARDGQPFADESAVASPAPAATGGRTLNVDTIFAGTIHTEQIRPRPTVPARDRVAALANSDVSGDRVRGSSGDHGEQPRVRTAAERNRLWLVWYDDGSSPCYKSYGAIRNRWNAMSDEDRSRYVPFHGRVPTGKPGWDVVRQGIRSARRELASEVESS